MKERLNTIAAIEKAREISQRKAIARIKHFQARCKHEKIIESPRRASDYGSAFPARRICVCCGVEEVISAYSWPAHTVDGGLYEFQRTPGQRTILNSEFVKKGDVCEYRIRL